MGTAARSTDQGQQGASELSLGALLKYAYFSWDGVATGALASSGVDRRELAVLNRLATGDFPSQQEVAHRLGIDRTTMVALIDGLEHRKLVKRRPDPNDRRRNIVELTVAGRRLAAKASPSVIDAEARFLEPLGAADARRFKHALQTLVSAWEDVRTNPPRDRPASPAGR